MPTAQSAFSDTAALQRSAGAVPAAGEWFAAAARGDAEAIAHLTRLGVHAAEGGSPATSEPVSSAPQGPSAAETRSQDFWSTYRACNMQTVDSPSSTTSPTAAGALPIDSDSPVMPSTPLQWWSALPPTGASPSDTFVAFVPASDDDLTASVASPFSYHLFNAERSPQHSPTRSLCTPHLVWKSLPGLMGLDALTSQLESAMASPTSCLTGRDSESPSVLSVPQHLAAIAVPVYPSHQSPRASSPALNASRSPAAADSRVDPVVQTLDSCLVDIQCLKRADGLRDVIEQMKRGNVQRICDLYGPRRGRPANPMWESIKVTISKRKRLWGVLERDFSGDEDAFFAFFTISADRHKKPIGRPSKLKTLCKTQSPASKTSPPTLRPSRQIAEAISHLRDDLAEAGYQYPYIGALKDAPWRAEYGEVNAWMVWRAMGKEKYGADTYRRHRAHKE